MRKAICWAMLSVVVLASSCIGRKDKGPVVDNDGAGKTANKQEATGNAGDETASIADVWSDATLPEGIAQKLPNTAVLRDVKGRMELYTNLDIAESDEHPNQWSLWLRDNKTEKVVFLIHTNNDAKPRWEQMKDRNAVEVPLEQIAAGDCDEAFLIPNGRGLVFVEGCPDSRNVWSYIYDIYNGRIIQLPSNEGFRDLDIRHHAICLSHYRYHPEGGRYSVILKYSYDGRFMGEEESVKEDGEDF